MAVKTVNKDQVLKTLKGRMARLRKAKEVTVDEMAAVCGMDPNTFRHTYYAHSSPQVDRLLQIALNFDIGIEELINSRVKPSF